MTSGFDQLKLPPGEEVDLSRINPADLSLWRKSKRKAETRLATLRNQLNRLQEMLYADSRFGLLVILQGMDTAGKDGVIRHVFEGVNPQGVRVYSFKEPTPDERAHDFLWRVHRDAPAKGEMAIFNRSHYEDVLIARVHNLVPRSVWSKRYDEINDFERELVDEGNVVVKFFLHVSRKEQALRLEDRIRDPAKRWKLSLADFHERRFWDQYMTAYKDALERTNTVAAPWYVLPSDHKWYRNLAVSSILVRRLQELKLRYPMPSVSPSAFKLH